MEQQSFCIAYHNNVSIEVLSHVNVALGDGVEGGDVNSARFETENAGLEKGFWCTETLVADGDDLTVRKLVCCLLYTSPSPRD